MPDDTKEGYAETNRNVAMPGQAAVGGDDGVRTGVLEIDKERFLTATSPNGRFTLAWTVARPEGEAGLDLGDRPGSWFLHGDGRVWSQGRLEWPHEGHVADDGRFILSDWLSGDAPASVFYAFGRDGRVLVERSIDANAGPSAISADGRYAVVETLRNPTGKWANWLLAYDLDAAELIWATRPPGSRAITIDLVRAKVVLIKGVGSMTADLISGAWDLGPPNQGSFEAFRELENLQLEMKRDLGSASAGEAVAWLGRARALLPQFETYPWRAAQLRRLEGEALEKLDRVDEAMAAYFSGLELNPNLGVRKRLKALGGELPPAPPPEPARFATRPVLDDRPYASKMCPSCGVELKPLPRRKSRCRACGAFVWVRGGPDGMRHVLREDQIEAHEALWYRYWEEKERVPEIADDGPAFWPARGLAGRTPSPRTLRSVASS